MRQPIETTWPSVLTIWKLFPTIAISAIAGIAILHAPTNETYRVFVAGAIAAVVFLNGVTGRLALAELGRSKYES